RYIVGVLTLFAMVTSVACTFVVLLNSQAAMQATESAATPFIVLTQKTFFAQTVQPALASAPAVKSLSAQALPLLVEFWLAGVLFFTLRTAGSLIYLERLRRAASLSVAPALLAKCRELQSRLGIARIIRFCECRWLDAPAVIGWFRPVVLLPVRALTGLTEDQIEAVIAHELAHIRRFDAFVNLLQLATETLLFYHPAVWWVSQRIRAERENCCDDEAIVICGDAVNYARALTLMEEWRTAPALMMAANRGPLAERVMRLLGWNGAAGRIRVAGLAGSFVCLVGALLAGNAFLGIAHAALGAGASPNQEQKSSVIVVKPETTAAKARTAQAPKPVPAPTAQPTPKPQTSPGSEPQTTSDGKKQSYMDAMAAAGIKITDVDELIALKIQGVTPEYIKGMHDLGLQPSAEELIGMKVQGITLEYVREMRKFDAHVGTDELIGMKVQGITPEYITEMRKYYSNLNVEDSIGMKVQGITPEYVRGFHDLGLQPNAEDVIGLKVQGVTPDYVKEMRAIGLKPNTEELIGMKVQGVTPE